MSGQRLMRNPLFIPLNLIERHRKPGYRLGGRATIPEPVHPTVPSSKRVWPLSLDEACWTGECLGCGKTLISATWRLSHPPVYCTRVCKEAHTDDS